LNDAEKDRKAKQDLLRIVLGVSHDRLVLAICGNPSDRLATNIANS
jgi:hypothetical protein